MITYPRYRNAFINKGGSISSKYIQCIRFSGTSWVKLTSENKSSTMLQNDNGLLFPEGELVDQLMFDKLRSPPTNIVALGYF